MLWQSLAGGGRWRCWRGGGKRNERDGLIKNGGVLRSRDGDGGKRRRAQRPGKCSALLEAMDEEEDC